MNYGRFFEFDFESSYLQKGIAVFNYRWLKITDGTDKKTPRYPVYLTFTPESFSFNLHYLKEKEDHVQGMDLSHYHNTIIEVRLAPNVDEAKGLAESLNNAYVAQFPLKKKNSNEVTTTVDDDLLKVVEQSFDAQDCLVEGYSLLDCFEPETKDGYKLENHDVTPHLLRKIILDFLFDLEFTNVFKNVAFYDELAAKLKDDFFFSALMNKTRYYYYRTELNAKEAVERCLQPGDDVDKSDLGLKKFDQGLKFFFEQYAKAERAWVNSILDKRAMKVFHESPWFDEAYQELEQVYFASRSDSWKKKAKGESQEGSIPIPKIEPVVPAGNAKRKVLARRRYLNRIGAIKDPFKLTVSNVLNLTRKRSPELRTVQEEKNSKGEESTKGKDPFKSAVRMHCDTAKKAAAWEVGHYHFVGLWKLWFGDVPTLVGTMLLLIPVLGLTLLLFVGFYYYQEPMIQFHDHSLWPLHVEVKFHTIYRPWSFILTMVPLALFMVAFGKMIRRHFRSTWGEGSMALMMPRLLAAVVTAWFTMTMSVDIVQLFAANLTVIHGPASIILATITLLFVVYEARLKNPFDEWPMHLLSASIVFVIAFIYSLIVGLMTYDFFAIPTIADLKLNIGEAEKCKWNFVIQFSFFATFIGIFLQLMFQGKSVADTE